MTQDVIVPDMVPVYFRSAEDEEGIKAALSERYGSVLAAQADAVRQVETDLEMLWDSVCYIDVSDPSAPQIGYNGEL